MSEMRLGRATDFMNRPPRSKTRSNHLPLGGFPNRAAESRAQPDVGVDLLDRVLMSETQFNSEPSFGAQEAVKVSAKRRNQLSDEQFASYP